MASRNIKGSSPTPTMLQQHDTSPFDTADKIQSSTLKRHPKMDLSKGDLLKLLSYLEGELQARDVVIATLKAEKAKQLLYQAKYGRFGLGDPFMALQRDSDNMKDSSFDESAIKLMYDNQLSQLENLIATQRKAQVKMREQLTAAEKRFHKATSELEDEKRKHAQDTAQGDDVTYMLEKERERLKQEVDFEKGQNKRLEKDLKKSLASLEEEKANSGKHKQVALMLIKERKKLEDILLLEKHKRNTAEQLLNTDKSKIRDIVDGLEEESKRSLKMEAVMEKQLSEFDVEREQLRNKFAREETRSSELQTNVEMLSQQLEALQVQLAQERAAVCATPQSIEIRSSLSPGKTKEGSREGSQTEVVNFPGSQYRKPVTPTKPTEKIALNSYQAAGQTELNLTSGGTTVYAMPSGGKLSVHVGGGGVAGNTPRKPVAVGRGTPPPVPPNKPILVSPLPGVVREGITRAISPKPTPPPKVGISPSKERAGFVQTDGQADGKSNKPVQIPVNQVNVVSNQPGGVRERAPDHSPMRKTTQQVSVAVENASDLNPPHLDFLGQEMADLQQVISSMATGESSSYSVNLSSSSSFSPSPSLHHLASTGNHAQLLPLLHDSTIDPCQPLHDGTTPLHASVEGAHEACTLALLEHNADVNAVRVDLITPLHIAAGAGHYRCLKLLVDHNGNVNQPDRGNWTPLHWAVTNGSLPCCHLLLHHGANLHLTTNEGWTPLHAAVNSGHSEVLKLVLTYFDTVSTHAKMTSHNDLINKADKDGWTISHLAALRQQQDCLQTLLENCSPDLSKIDNWGRTVYELASLPCKDFLSKTAIKNSPNCTVCIAITTAPDGSADLIGLDGEAIMGSIQVTLETSWDDLEDRLRELLCVYFKNLDTGLKTRKTTRLEPDPTNQPFTLGLSIASVKQFSIGLYFWSPGSVFHISPYEIMCNNNSYQVRVHLGGGDSFPDSASFETLIPVTTVQNYIRLIEQYKSVVFYGPVGSGKSLLADRLAHCVQMKAKDEGFLTELIQLTCTVNFNYQDLVKLLLLKGCIVQLGTESGAENYNARAPILILNELDKINIAEVFGDLLKSLEHRGENSTFKLKGLEGKEDDLFYFVDNFYLIATMDRTRSTGLELSVQQRFRWVHFRVDTEPTKHLLARHLFRRLIHTFGGVQPLIENPVYKAVEWVVCVWQRLNDGLAKLGLPEVVFGPGLFFSCPIWPNDPQQTLLWLCEVWNSTLAPVVTDAVVKGTGAEASQGGQQKVANTALYVLMQRSVMAGCPLTGTEKEKYISQFQGSNELDIPIRSRSHSNSELYLSPCSPLSPTVQLKSILGITSPEARDSNKRTSWLQTGKHPMKTSGPTDRELPHKIPALRLTTSKSVSDTDLTASLPKVRRLEIRTPNLLNPGSKIHSSSTGIIPRSSSLPIKSSSAPGLGLKSPKGSSDSSAFKFSPPSTSLSQMSFSSSNSSSPTFTTKLPRAVTIMKTTLSSVGQNSNKLSGLRISPDSSNKGLPGGHNVYSHSNEATPRLNLSSPKRYTPKTLTLSPGSIAHNSKNESAKTFQFHSQESWDSVIEPPNPKSPKKDEQTVPVETPLHIETSLNWYESKTSPFQIVQSVQTNKESANSDMRQSFLISDSNSSSVMTVENGPRLIVPQTTSNARAFLLSGHKNANSDRENSLSASIPNNNPDETSAFPSEQNIKNSAGFILPPDEISLKSASWETIPDVIPKADVSVDKDKELVFSPGRTEINIPMEVLAKVLKDEERVSLC